MWSSRRLVGRHAWAAVALAASFAAGPPAAAAPAANDAATYRLKPGAYGAVCMNCHMDFQETIKRPHVHTPVKAGRCADCHDPHASDHGKLLADAPDKICTTCHGTMIPEGAVSTHAAVTQGKCGVCHDPHGSANSANLVRPGNDLCLACHEDVKKALAAATHKHTPASANCLGCHDAHASKTAPALLRKPPPALCVGCHSPTQPGFVKAHLGYPVARSNCSSCHDPHGSPNKGILWASVHAPVQNKMCVQCHGEPVASGPITVKKTAPELCRSCHNETFVEIASKNRVHWPVVDRQACAHCHEPHASKTPKLLIASQTQLCGRCHPDAIARQEKSLAKHPPNADGECSVCHAPHASDRTFLFAGSSDEEVCGTCHDWKAHSAHPLGEKAVDKRNPNLRLDCESCHRTHGTAFKSFAHYDTKGELCTQCHVEFTR